MIRQRVDNGNSCPHLGHLANLHCTDDGQVEHAKARPYDMSKVKLHFGQFSKCLDLGFIYFAVHERHGEIF